VKTSALSVIDLDFPAITVCGQGNNEEVLASGFLKMFADFLKQKGINLGLSPIQATRILKKIMIQVNQQTAPFWLKIVLLCSRGIGVGGKPAPYLHGPIL
jgi:hypothetical protein